MYLALADFTRQDESFKWKLQKSFELWLKSSMPAIEILEKDSFEAMLDYKIVGKVEREADGKLLIVWSAEDGLEDAPDNNKRINEVLGLDGTEDSSTRHKVYCDWMFKNSKYCNRNGKTHEEIWGITRLLPNNQGEN